MGKCEAAINAQDAYIFRGVTNMVEIVAKSTEEKVARDGGIADDLAKPGRQQRSDAGRASERRGLRRPPNLPITESATSPLVPKRSLGTRELAGRGKINPPS